MVDVALFELEGVLFETHELRRVALREALHEHGIDEPIDAEIVDGLTPRVAALESLTRTHAVWDDVLLDLIALTAERSFSRHLATSGAALRSGAGALLDAASSHCRMAAVTRARRADADTMLRLAGLESVFAVTVCADNVLEPKPSPMGYEVALARLGRQRPVTTAAVIAVEDGLPGIRAARAAGVRCVAVGAIAAHVAIEADALVESLEGHSLRSLDALSRPGGERVP